MEKLFGINMFNIILISILLLSPTTVAGFRKCCPIGQIMDLHTKRCLFKNSELSESFSVDVYSMSSNKTTEEQFLHKDVPTTEDYQCAQLLRYNFDFQIIKAKSSYFIVDSHRNKQYYTEAEACIDEALDTKTETISLVAQACLTCSAEKPCVNFCCPVGTINIDGECVKMDDVEISEIEKDKEVLSLGLHCANPFSYPRNLWNLTMDGEMNVDGTIRSVSEYCVNLENETEPSLLLCPKEEVPTDYKKVLKMVFMCLTMLSIFTMIVFHIAIKDLWQLRFTKLKIPLYVFLFLSFLVIVITNLNDFTGTYSCIFWALALQYFSLGIFFWLTSMSLDIWLTFRTIKNPLQNRHKKETQHKFKMKCYYVFSFGSPLVVSIVTGVLQLTYNTDEAPFIHPNIGVSCMLGQYLPQFLYFHVIVFILLCVNMVFYSLMVFNFTCGIWKPSMFGKRHMSNLKFFLELVFIMGINWTSESASFFVGWQYQREWDHPLIVVFNSINWFTGVAILLLFFSKSNNRNLVKNLFCEDRDNLDYYDLARTFSTQLSDKEDTFKVIYRK